jgi:hypothetical protein
MEMENMDIDTELENLEIIERKRYMIIGLPERIIAENKISYKIPVESIDEDGNENGDIKYLTISEEEMNRLLASANEMFADKDSDIAYV